VVFFNQLLHVFRGRKPAPVSNKPPALHQLTIDNNFAEVPIPGSGNRFGQIVRSTLPVIAIESHLAESSQASACRLSGDMIWNLSATPLASRSGVHGDQLCVMGASRPARDCLAGLRAFDDSMASCTQSSIGALRAGRRAPISSPRRHALKSRRHLAAIIFHSHPTGISKRGGVATLYFFGLCRHQKPMFCTVPEVSASSAPVLVK